MSFELIRICISEEKQNDFASCQSDAELLVTLDREHLLDRNELVLHVGSDIVTPKEVVRRLREGNEEQTRCSVNQCLLAGLV